MTQNPNDPRVGFRPTQAEKDAIDAFVKEFNYGKTAAFVRRAVFDRMRAELAAVGKTLQIGGGKND